MNISGLSKANMGTDIGSQSSQKDGFLPGSRLNLNPVTRDKLQVNFFDASNYARKSYGGNT